MYQAILILLIACSIYEVVTGKRNKYCFLTAYLLMTFVATFRYGQMTDYFCYYAYYDIMGIYVDTDFVYEWLMQFFHWLGAGFVLFSALMSFLCMVMSFRFFYKNCDKSCVSLLIFYSYTFLLCNISGIRQGLCISMLLFSISYLREKRYWLFIILLLIGTGIHQSFILVSIIPFVMRIKIFNSKYIPIIVTLLSILVLTNTGVAHLISSERLMIYTYATGGQNPILRVALRLLILLPMLAMKPTIESDAYQAKAICITGYIIYCLLGDSDLAASRIEYYFRIFVCVYASWLVAKTAIIVKPELWLYLLLSIHIFLWYRNIELEIHRCGYRPAVTVWNFPFVSVFNKSDLSKYRVTDYYY